MKFLWPLCFPKTWLQVKGGPMDISKPIFLLQKNRKFETGPGPGGKGRS